MIFHHTPDLLITDDLSLALLTIQSDERADVCGWCTAVCKCLLLAIMCLSSPSQTVLKPLFFYTQSWPTLKSLSFVRWVWMWQNLIYYTVQTKPHARTHKPTFQYQGFVAGNALVFQRREILKMSLYSSACSYKSRRLLYPWPDSFNRFDIFGYSLKYFARSLTDAASSFGFRMTNVVDICWWNVQKINKKLIRAKNFVWKWKVGGVHPFVDCCGSWH